MNFICAYEHCTACCACLNICPKSAIKLEEKGPLGFFHPTIDQSLCIDCGLCEKICPVNHPVTLNKPISSYAVTCKNESEVKASASGGAAYALSKKILEDGGVVYGCEMEDYRTIKHCRYTTEHDMERMRGSKYVQSNIGLILKSVKDDLMRGNKVLFTGTPCQVAGLKSFLRKDYDNLYTVDLVCHGVPSQKLLREDIESILDQQGISIPVGLKVHFREKRLSKNAKLDIKYGVFFDENMSLLGQEFLRNNYITSFMSCLTIRDNCYTCVYAQARRCSDITVADYWGLGDNCVVNRQNGISLLLPSTKKGVSLLNASKKFMLWQERTVEEAINGNGRLMSPSVVPINRQSFIQDYQCYGVKAYDKHLKKYRKEYVRKEKLTSFVKEHPFYALPIRFYWKISRLLSKVIS